MSEPDWMSTDDFVRGPFPPHGHFRITHQNGIYLYEARGPFNEVTIEALAPVRAAVMQHWPVPMGEGLALVHWHDSAMMSPTAFELFSEGYRRFAKSPRLLKAVAWVGAPDTEGLDLIAYRFEQLYIDTDTPFRLFAEVEPALAWLRAQP